VLVEEKWVEQNVPRTQATCSGTPVERQPLAKGLQQIIKRRIPSSYQMEQWVDDKLG
jgi:hypothetical protein